MIRDACAAFFAAGALGWGIRLLWMGAPVVQPESPPPAPWIDASGAAMMTDVLNELEPSLQRTAPAQPSDSALEAARETLVEPKETAPSPAAEGLARCIDAAREFEIDARWQLTTGAPDPLIEAEFRCAVERAVPFWNAVLNATEASPLTPQSCQWSLVEPLSEEAATAIIGRVRFVLGGEDAFDLAAAGAAK